MSTKHRADPLKRLSVSDNRLWRSGYCFGPERQHQHVRGSHSSTTVPRRKPLPFDICRHFTEALRSKAKSLPILGPTLVRVHRRTRRLLNRMRHFRLGNQIDLLFSESGVRTFAGGFSHARFVQSTDLTNSIHTRIIEILEYLQLPYMLAAGHLVGHARDGRVPLWAEDLDIIILPDAFELFEVRCIPALRQAGFDVLATTDWQPDRPFGGYAVLGLSTTETHINLKLSATATVRAPRAQVDVFFSTIDEHGFLRNIGGWWGPYHSADLPADIVLPMSEIELGGRRFTTFRDPAAAVQLEYGDVERWVYVYSHFFEHKHLLFFTPSWERFRQRLDDVIAQTTSPLLPGGPREPLRSVPNGGTYKPSEHEALETILEELTKNRYSTVILTGKLVLWVLDLKHWFPGIRVLYRPTSEFGMCLGLQLAHLIEGIADGHV